MNTSDRQERRVMTVLVLVVSMAVLSGTMVNVVLPIVGRAFDVTEGTYGWLVTGYAITFGLFSAVHGRLADNIGTRKLYVIGLVTYSALALLVGLCPSIYWMIGLRVVQGAGAAAMPALGTLIISRTFPESRRGWALGMILGVVGLSASIGPFVGGLIADWISWRAVFLFPSVSLCIVPFAFRTLPESLDKVTPQPMDWISVLWLGGFVATALSIPSLIGFTGFGGWMLIASTAAPRM